MGLVSAVTGGSLGGAGLGSGAGFIAEVPMGNRGKSSSHSKPAPLGKEQRDIEY